MWASDITYVPMPQGWMYLTVVMDWFSRCVLSWRLSNTLDGLFCLEALEEALGGGTPEIFNTDQGVQYTKLRFLWKPQFHGPLLKSVHNSTYPCYHHAKWRCPTNLR